MPRAWSSALLLTIRLFTDLCPCQVKGTNIFKVPEVVEEEEEPKEEVPVVVPKKPVPVPKKPVPVPKKPEAPEAKGIFLGRSAYYLSVLIIFFIFCFPFLG